MTKLSNKEDFIVNPEIYTLLTELELASNSNDSLAPFKVQVLLDKLKKLNISFKVDETIIKKRVDT